MFAWKRSLTLTIHDRGSTWTAAELKGHRVEKSREALKERGFARRRRQAPTATRIGLTCPIAYIANCRAPAP
jgi:hypothetical protein